MYATLGAMLFSLAAIVLTLPFAITSPISSPAHSVSLHRRAANTGSYTVTSGDTGYAIAAVYSITFSTLSSANPGVNWDSLWVGQSIKMPSARLPVPYKTVTGDTESTITKKYNIYGFDLRNANPNVDFSALGSNIAVRVPAYGQYTSYTVTSGDSGSVVAGAFSISFNSLSAANPTVNWSTLQTGRLLTIPAGISPSYNSLPAPAISPMASTTPVLRSTPSGSVRSTTTISRTTGTSVALRRLPSSSNSRTALVSTTPSTAPPTSTASATSSTSSYTLSRTTSVTSSSLSSTTTSIPTTPTTTTSSVPQTTLSTTASATATPSVTGANAVTVVNNNDGGVSRGDTYTFYQGDSSQAAGWPSVSQWTSFSTMWSAISPFFGTNCQSIFGVPNNSADETQTVYNAIQAIAQKSYVDHRLILAVIVQESAGCVRAPTTISPDGTVVNPGLMQSFNGVGSCNRDGVIQNPCPASQIYQMVGDGVYGTGNPAVAGLVQDINGQNAAGYGDAMAIYRSARVYNSGSVPSSGDLGAPGATRCYCSDIANRLTGWVTASRTCSF